jgi:hypothetical protein
MSEDAADEAHPCPHYVKDTPPWRDVGRVEWVCAECGAEFLVTTT